MLVTDSQALKQYLENAQHIAVIGHSEKRHRTSYQIAHYLRSVGYIVYPVNPTVTEIDGAKSYASLAELPVTPDIVDVFRRSEYLPAIVEEAIAIAPTLVWAQLGVSSEDALKIATEAGLPIVMDKCIKIEHARLLG